MTMTSNTFLSLLSLLAFVGVSSCYQNAVYFPSWAIYKRDYHPQDLPVAKITHILYAFLDVLPSGQVYTRDPWADLEKHYETDSWSEDGENAYGCVKQLFMLKKTNRGLKTMLSIGGWTQSVNFPAAASTQEGVLTFARSSVALMKDWGFDGIDIDWEYPRSRTEADGLVRLLAAVRRQLDEYAAQHAPGRHFLLTIASPAGPDHYEKLDLKTISSLVDVFYLMGYDYAGSWDKYAGHQANLYTNAADPRSTPFSTDAAVKAYLDAGVPASKIVLGMPLYGRAFQDTDGMGKPFSGVGDGSWEPGAWDYKALPHPGAEVTYDDVVASSSYDRLTRTVVSFDTPEVVEKKVSYIKRNGLAGSMFWEASGDKPGEDSLISTSFEALGSGCEGDVNQLDYPDSRYENIKNALE